jgi:uncharacterized membrane protein (DUF106 family)
MKTLILLVLTLITASAQAQTFLVIDEHMSPFCRMVAPLMGVFVVGAIGYAVVKAITGKDKV